MSHSSGIQASPELLQTFSQAVQEDNIRLIKISIVNESLVVSKSIPVKGTWQDDFSQIVDQFEDKIPTYVVYRLDDKGVQGHHWVFFCYVPDYAYVRDKMLYASTRASLRKSLGDYYFSDEMYGTDKAEFTYEGYLKHRKSITSAPALTQREEEVQRMRKEESGADIGITTKKAHVHGVYFPLSSDAETQLQHLKSKTVNYVQLIIDSEKESIELGSSSNVDATEIAALTPDDAPRYHFFRYRHAFEDNTVESLIFLYSCPLKSKVKERMLYSSCKASVLAVTTELGLEVEKNSEVGDVAELTEGFIFEELHPKKLDEKKAFKKPSKPGRPATKKPGSSTDDLTNQED